MDHPWDAAKLRAGLHPAALEFIAERKVAVLGSDSNSDTAPSLAEGVETPVHVLAINALGLHLLDYLQFEDLVPLRSSPPRRASCSGIFLMRPDGHTRSFTVASWTTRECRRN